jgi:demethylmenaquinone methyltransferase/2-methoxy-6-polyprenyl-1,4-benzoquinol methylase
MSAESSMVEYYARRASEYERIYQRPERQDDLNKLGAILEHFFAGRHVLETACGTGYWTQRIARTAASVVATDINEEVLAMARSKPSTKAVTFRREDAYALSHLEEKFDAGLSAFWWSHVPKARLTAFLDGFHRRLTPGARVLFVDNTYVEGNSTALARTDADGNTFQMRTLDDGSTHEVLKNFPTATELRNTIAGAGHEVRVQQLRYYWILSYVLRESARHS